jgi:hypothetical protein
MSREENVYMARLAEQAERYEGELAARSPRVTRAATVRALINKAVYSVCRHGLVDEEGRRGGLGADRR